MVPVSSVTFGSVASQGSWLGKVGVDGNATWHLCPDTVLFDACRGPDRAPRVCPASVGVLRLCRQRVRTRRHCCSARSPRESDAATPLARRLPPGARGPRGGLVHRRPGSPRACVGRPLRAGPRCVDSVGRIRVFGLSVCFPPLAVPDTTVAQQLPATIATSCHGSDDAPDVDLIGRVFGPAVRRQGWAARCRTQTPTRGRRRGHTDPVPASPSSSASVRAGGGGDPGASDPLG